MNLLTKLILSLLLFAINICPSVGQQALKDSIAVIGDQVALDALNRVYIHDKSSNTVYRLNSSLQREVDQRRRDFSWKVYLNTMDPQKIVLICPEASKLYILDDQFNVLTQQYVTDLLPGQVMNRDRNGNQVFFKNARLMINDENGTKAISDEIRVDQIDMFRNDKQIVHDGNLYYLFFKEYGIKVYNAFLNFEYELYDPEIIALAEIDRSIFIVKNDILYEWKPGRGPMREILRLTEKIKAFDINQDYIVYLTEDYLYRIKR
ncbi:MAG TPA: hypothetical protein PK006_08740 [Saprospiraceae bacterium]|nr:hypothetical protein [Saprospiraceae bacterium]